MTRDTSFIANVCSEIARQAATWKCGGKNKALHLVVMSHGKEQGEHVCAEAKRMDSWQVHFYMGKPFLDGDFA